MSHLSPANAPRGPSCPCMLGKQAVIVCLRACEIALSLVRWLHAAASFLVMAHYIDRNANGCSFLAHRGRTNLHQRSRGRHGWGAARQQARLLGRLQQHNCTLMAFHV